MFFEKWRVEEYIIFLNYKIIKRYMKREEFIMQNHKYGNSVYNMVTSEVKKYIGGIKTKEHGF